MIVKKKNGFGIENKLKWLGQKERATISDGDRTRMGKVEDSVQEPTEVEEGSISESLQARGRPK